MKLKFFTTGGTIDKIYFDAKGEYAIGEPQVSLLLADANVGFEFEIESLLRKDSLDMTEADRALIAEQCRATPGDRIVITHGTDTMAETARFVAERVQGKTIVLTGAMVPYKFGSSDGLFNLGSGRARTWLDLAHALFDAMERPRTVEFIDMPQALIEKYQYFTEARMDRLRAAGYEPPFAPLEDGIRKYVRHYLETDDPFR